LRNAYTAFPRARFARVREGRSDLLPQLPSMRCLDALRHLSWFRRKVTAGQIRQLRALRDGRASPRSQCGKSLLRLNPMSQYLVPFPSRSPPQPPRTGRAARRATSFTSRTPESEGDRHLRGRLAPSWRAWRALDRHLRGDCLNCRTLPASVSWWSRTRALRGTRRGLVGRTGALRVAHPRLSRRIGALRVAHPRLSRRIGALRVAHPRLFRRIGALRVAHPRLFRRIGALRGARRHSPSTSSAPRCP